MTRPFNIGGVCVLNSGPGDNTAIICDERSATELAEHDMKLFEEIRLEEQNSVVSTDPPKILSNPTASATDRVTVPQQ
jgi:predicted RNase H-like nuclease